MMTKYVTNAEYNFEKVNRASQACGPLVKWAIAQVFIELTLLLLLKPIFFLLLY